MSNETLSDETLAGLAQRARDTLPGCRNYAQTSFVVSKRGSIFTANPSYGPSPHFLASRLAVKHATPSSVPS
jgi:hypothetical protein